MRSRGKYISTCTLLMAAKVVKWWKGSDFEEEEEEEEEEVQSVNVKSRHRLLVKFI